MENIRFQEEPYPDAEILEALHPFVREWFTSTFEGFSPPQKYSIRNIQLGLNSLISSPTGSGKTLSAFLAVINELVTLADLKQLEDRVYCIYISPLKALANDINRNLTEPLKAIERIAQRNGRELGIRVGTRTGDTTAKERAKMLVKAPHILITTPESLAITLSTTKFSEMLRTTRYLIIDEIHALAENKRGTHLMLSVERLARHARFTRIGLSATVAPLEEMALFLVGIEDPYEGTSRACEIIDVSRIKDGYRKKLDLKVLSAVPDLMDTSHTVMQDKMYELLDRLIQEHRSTLIFTNTRSATERVVHQLKDRYPSRYANILDVDEEQDVLQEVEGPQHEHLAEEAELEEGAGTESITDATENDKKEHRRRPRVNQAREVSGATANGAENEVTGTEASRAARSLGSPDAAMRRKEEELPGTRPSEGGLTDKSLIGAHHGSLSKAHRLKIETMLKAGQLRCVVCSTSLELGIDIGFIDLVILLGSPKSVARALQRIGRSGHKLHAEAKGRIIVLDRDDLVECSILLKSALEKKIDRIAIPRAPLDVLAQHLYGMAIEDVTFEEDAWKTVRSAAPYRTLTRKEFDDTLAYLAGEHSQLEKRSIYAKIWREDGKFGKKGKLARLIYMTNIGTIPDETNVKVKIAEAVIGTVTEEFAERLKPGDVFVLGGEPYEFRFSRGTTIQVRTSAGRLPTVPSWISEMLPLNYDLASEIQRFRGHMAGMLADKKSEEAILAWLRDYLPNDETSIQAIYRYFREQHRFSIIPNDKRILIEHFKDGNKKYVFVHTLYGRRVNDVLARALAYTNGRLTGRDVEIGITDTGFSLKSTQPIQAQRALGLIKHDELPRLMDLALEKSEVLKRRFRHCAGRSLMILRTYRGEQKSVGRQQISSQIIMSMVQRIGPDFPILKETRREILEDLMDITHAIEVVKRINAGSIKVEERTTDLPSPFAFNLVMQGYTDLLRVEDRVEFIKRLHQMVLQEIGEAPKREKDAKKERVFATPEIVYERLWAQQHEEERKRKEDLQGLIREQLRDALRKERLGADTTHHLQRLIEGELSGYPDSFKEWLGALLKGTIKKHWKDDLVKRMREMASRI